MQKSFVSLVFVVLIILIPTVMANSQPKVKNFQELKGSYLGQVPPGDTAKLFAPGIVSSEYFEHSSPVFSPDLNEIYWSVKYPNDFEPPRTILFMKRENDCWSQPQIAPFAQHGDCENPFISSDGKSLFFNANLSATADNMDIWRVNKTETGWSEPIKLGSPPNSNNKVYFPTVAQNGNIYFLCNSESKPGIYCSRFVNGSYLLPVLLENPISTEYGDWTGYIAPNENYFIFSSFRPEGLGIGDLYITFKQKDNSWSPPINMGKKINTPANERFPNVTPDGKYLFFNSTRKIAGAGEHDPGNGNGDVYWISAKVIEELRPKEVN
jgi:hypothetical protein